jgi:hypothetical protein
MNKQSHFEPKPKLRATSVFAARPHFAVVELVPPVVGNTPSIPSFLMCSHFQSIGTGFYGVRPVRYQFDRLSEVIREPFWGGRRGATERPNGAKLCIHVKETWMNKQSHFEPKPTFRAISVFAARLHFAVVEGVPPVVGNTPSIPSFLMCSHFQSIGTGFYWVRPVRYRFDHLSKVVRESFSRRNRASKWRQTLQTCGGELEGHTKLFWTESEALCLFRIRQLTPE